MENQDHRKNNTPGHESHGVHVCHKCGWPFPNPHPSARHRRAHKKICGTIEGYKLVDAEGSAHSTVSDDEHLSDEDDKSPGPRILERSKDEKGSIEIGEKSARSEDEVFSDAVAEFSDSGSGKSIGESPEDVKKPTKYMETIVENDKGTTLSYEDSAIDAVGYKFVMIPIPDFHDTPSICNCAATITHPSEPTDSGQLQITEVRESIFFGSAQESQDHVSSATTIDLTERDLTDSRTEESVYNPSAGNEGSNYDTSTIQLESQSDASRENDEKIACGDFAGDNAEAKEETQINEKNYGDRLNETKANENEETNLDRMLLNVSPSDTVCDVSQTVSKLQEKDITSNPPLTADVGQLKEQSKDELVSEMPLSGLSPEVESVEPANIHATSQIDASNAHLMAPVTYVKSIGMEEGNANFHTLSIPEDTPVVENADSMIRGYKDHKGGKLPQLVDIDSFVCDRIICSTNEGTQVSAMGIHVLKDNLEGKGGNKSMIENFPGERDTGMLEVEAAVSENKIMEEFGVPKDVEIDNEKIQTAQFSEEVKLLDDCCNSQTISVKHVTEVLSDVNTVAGTGDVEVRQTAKLVSESNSSGYDKDGIKRCDVAENEDKRITEESRTENMVLTSEPPSVLSVLDLRTNSFGGKNDAYRDKGKVESYYFPETETGEGNSTLGSLDGNLSVAATTMPESACNLWESNVASEKLIKASERNLSEHECIPSSGVSDNQVDVKELERDDSIHGKVQVEVADMVSAAAESINSGESDPLQKSFTKLGAFEVLPKPSDKVDDSEVFQKSSGEDVKKEPQFSPSDASLSIQNSATVGDDLARDIVGGASENLSEAASDKCQNKFVSEQLLSTQNSSNVGDDIAREIVGGASENLSKASDKCENKQINASAADFSVDSGSQTDSLEGHWGSVSVLSTQSDMPSTADTEPLASNGSKAEKADVKSLKTLPEGQHSDTFEPPSFMTLVEPKGIDKAADSDIQTQQAGWFPSLSNVVNDSQGRKKNEEIIAKVTNWSTGKQHTPLKNLLGEASAATKSKSPKPIQVVQSNEDASKKDSSSTGKTVNSNVGPELPVSEPVKKEAGKEWNSPARYPADIKREKRKVKGRPYWAQFVCCASVN